MKKLILVALMFVTIGMNAQNWVALSTGSTADTLIQSETFSKTFKVNGSETPSVSVQVYVDSISGTPGATATLYQSLDNVNWISTGQTATWSTGVDTSFALTDTTFYGVYGKLSIVATATAQRSQIRATKMHWNKR